MTRSVRDLTDDLYRAHTQCAELRAELAEAKESVEKWKALAEVAQRGWEGAQRG